MIGVLLTNGFENDHEDVPGRAIYPTLSLCSHSCRANLRHAVNPGHQVALQVRPFMIQNQLFPISNLFHDHHICFR